MALNFYSPESLTFNVDLNKENVRSLVTDIFPGYKIKTIKLLDFECSNNYIINLCGINDNTIFIKHPKISYDIGHVYELNKKFLKEKQEDLISSPLIYHVDYGKKIFVMDYIEGLNLHQLFTSIKLTKQNDLKRAIDLSAIALAEFHKIFKKDQFCDKIANFDELIRNYDMEFINECIPKCNLNFKTKLFSDFKFGNILFDPARSKLYLIDFPEKDYVFTPHYDIAEFRKEIYIFSQHPKFKLLNKWSNPTIIYDRFFSTYHNYLGIQPNENDESIIKYFSNNMLKHVLKHYLEHPLGNLNIIKYPFIKKACRMNMIHELKV